MRYNDAYHGVQVTKSEKHDLKLLAKNAREGLADVAKAVGWDARREFRVYLVVPEKVQRSWIKNQTVSISGACDN